MAHQLKGYKFILFTPVYHDDKFVWNTEKEIVIHARSENGAKKKIESKLEKGKEVVLSSGLKIRTDDQFIYRIDFLGKAMKTYVWEYING